MPRLQFAPAAAPLWLRAIGAPVLLCIPLGAAHALPSAIEAGVSNQNVINAGDALLTTCQSGLNGSNQFQSDCNAIFGASDPLVSANALNQVTADQVAAQNSAATRQFSANIGVVGSRLAQIRLAEMPQTQAEGTALAALHTLGSAQGGGASADASFGRLGAFLNVKHRWGDKDPSRFETGYDFDGWGITAGADYRFTDNLTAGVALNLTSDDIDYDGRRGDMSSDTRGLLVYATQYWDTGLFVDGMVGYSRTDYDLKRRINYSSGSQTVRQTATSDTDGKLVTLSLGAGYSIPKGALTITPGARIDYLRNKIDGFSETISSPSSSGGGMPVGFESASYKSLTSRLGVQLSRAFSHSGGVILPSARLDWVHEFENRQQRISGRYMRDVSGLARFELTTDKPDRDYFDLELAVSAQFAGGTSAFLSYNTLLGLQDVDYHSVNAGVRMEF